jgi:hypothetical protein
MRYILALSLLLAALAICAPAACDHSPADPWSKPINASIDGGSLREVVRTSLKDTGISCLFAQFPDDPDDYEITAEFNDMPLETALRRVVEAANCSYTKNGNIVYIVRKPAGRNAKFLPSPQIEEDHQSTSLSADTQRAQPGDLDIFLHLYTRDGTITAGEPLVAKVQILNRRDHLILIAEGNNQGFNRQVVVLDARGEIVAKSPAPRVGEDGISGISSLAPGEVKSVTMILTGLYNFATPGKYTVRVQQLDDSKDLKILAMHSDSLRVLPYNPKRLAATLEDLYAPIRGVSASPGEVKAYLWTDGVRSKALLSVRDEMVLPYLEGMAKKWSSGEPVRAMLRLGTQQAISKADQLASRKDKLGESARSAQETADKDVDVAWAMNWL